MKSAAVCSVDASLVHLQPLLTAAFREFRLPLPHRIREVGASEAADGGYFGRIITDAGETTILLSSPAWDPIPLWTLAHELAHLRHWKHGDAHRRLTVRIMEWMQNHLLQANTKVVSRKRRR